MESRAMVSAGSQFKISGNWKAGQKEISTKGGSWEIVPPIVQGYTSSVTPAEENIY
jgi:hypothetical protein